MDELEFGVEPEMDRGMYTGNVIVSVELTDQSYMTFYLSGEAATQLSSRLVGTLRAIEAECN